MHGRYDGIPTAPPLPLFPVPLTPFDGFLEEEDRKVKAILAASIVALFVAPAFAADEFYVVQDSKTKTCTIVDKQLVDTTTTVR